MSVDLPEPDTPVTQVSNPTGSSSATRFRLLPRAPEILSRRIGSAGWRRLGSAMLRRPER